MSATRKLSQFRQLSLNCESPSPQQKRKTLKKQFSEDIPDFNNTWFDQRHEIQISLNTKNKKNDKNISIKPPPPIIAWDDKNEIKEESFVINEESVIIKKCKEVKRVPSGRLTRHASLEKDSILNSNTADRFRLKNTNFEKENEKSENKTNLQIFLAHNTQDFTEDLQTNISDSQTLVNSDQPKFLQPLVTNVVHEKAFQIRKSGNRKPLDSPKAVDVSQKRPNFSRSNTIVVVPLVEKNKDDKNYNTSRVSAQAVKDLDVKPSNNDDINGINVIIRPVTAQSRREKFQKRTNSAFHGTSKEQQLNFRPPLVRSSSAPSTKPEKSKFLATKRKIKTLKKTYNSPKDEDRSYNNVKEWKNAAPVAPEIVTMISLLTPSGSDNEDGSEDEEKERPKSVLKRESSIVEKNINSVKEEESKKEVVKNVSLRKTVKSVSFQQSSIHAIRSFSASFPARRGSMATALSLGNNNNNAQAKNTATVSKTQEKRGTNPSSPDANERVPKRRLVRSYTEEAKSSSMQQGPSHTKQLNKTEKSEIVPITIDIHTKPRNQETEEKFSETSMKLNLDDNVILLIPEVKERENASEETKIEDPPSQDTPKEKQCWAMYCKMTEKGINVSYDTILRGMLTPTEYRMRRKPSIAEEMNMLVNPPLTDSTAETSEFVKNKPNI